MIGGPATGKTTICNALAKAWRIRAFHGGQLLRTISQEYPASADKELARGLLSRGDAIPASMYCRLLGQLAPVGDDPSIIFDGYPRSISQFLAIPAVLASAGIPGARVVGLLLRAAPDSASQRIAHRMVCARCGEPWSDSRCCTSRTPVRREDDDDQETVARRRRNADRLAPQLLRRFRSRWTGFSVSSRAPVAEVVLSVAQKVNWSRERL